MRNREKDAREMALKRDTILENAFHMFTSNGIESVSYLDIAKTCGYGTTTLHRYFSTKSKLVVAVAAWKWEQVWEEKDQLLSGRESAERTAAGIFEFYLDSFIELYRNHKDILRFNQFFNVYVQSERIDTGTLQPYQDFLESIRKHFHEMYILAEKDGTLRTDVPEEELFSTTLHLMLAAVTRYAVGLVYIPEKSFDPEKELRYLKELLLRDNRL